ncbi:MAG: SurA N-terminal domain-containing protein [Elusimicrobia bacterium]|nr:SurA N-terminal domain-containing protein [Elusimicrobiota bacterium]
MKKLVVSALLFVSMFMFGCAKEQKQSVVALVNGSEISEAEFTKALESAVRFVNSQNPQSLKEPFARDILGKRVLNDMIIRELFFQQAKNSKIEATQEEVDNVIARIKENFKVNAEGKELTPEEQEAAFKEATKGQNLIENIKKDLMVEKYKKALITTNLKPVSQEDVKTFFDNVSAVYNNNQKKIEELKTQGRYEESEIVARQLKPALAPKAQFDLLLIYADKNMTKEELAQRKQIADTIRKEIKGESNFLEVAQKYSQQEGARIYFSKMNVFKGMKPLELTDKAFALKPGDVSKVFEIFVDDAQNPNTAQGYFIMNVLEQTAEQKFAFEPVQAQLEQYINTKRAESIIAQATQALVKEADIEILKTFKVDKVMQSSQTANQSTEQEQPAA